jgi:outer membrane murein-binding lipoprotein Lpp
MTYLLFGVALSLSAIAAYYAIMGLMAIFAAAAIPIAIMGSLLEVSKLTVASWLYQNWKSIPRLLKGYFTIALFVLMLLTSMGIFGFLSKAHLDQAVPTGDISAKLALLDEKIKTEKENINASRKELSQLDAQVDQTISRTTDAGGAERAITIRRAQQKDRARILADIGSSQAKIAKLNEERQPIAAEVRKVEAEVGPIKYIAALIYGDNPETDVLEKSVRWVIIMIVLVFDPLAVLMLVAANWNLRNNINSSWTSLFIKEQPPTNQDDLQLPEVKEVKLEDDITISDKPDAWIADVGEKPTSEELKESELPEIKIDENTKEWDPQLYKRRELGRYQQEIGATPPKTTSFLNKVSSLFTPKTIEKEVDDLQNKKNS